MDDRFLQALRREPDPSFASSLKGRLDELDDAPASGWRRHRRLFGALAGAAALAMSFVLPSVRATAQSVLDIFRVQNITALPFDADRLQRLDAAKLDGPMLVLGDVEVLKQPGPPRAFGDWTAAVAAFGEPVASPAAPPRGFAPDSILLTDGSTQRAKVHSERLRPLLEALDLGDVAIPPGLDGANVTVHMNPMLMRRFSREGTVIRYFVTRSPEVELPPGLDLERFGELGLRILGLDARAARNLAGSIDWRNTLVVPVPLTAVSFRNVTVRGARGLLVMSQIQVEGRPRARASLLWTERGRVHALQGGVGGDDLVTMAESIR